jgi:hypothetical protein
LISGIRIATRQGMRGFETQVFLGENRGPFLSGNKSREKKKLGDDKANKVPRIDVTFE